MLNAASADDVVTGVAQVDRDHKILVGLMNDLLSACFASQGPLVLSGILDELIAYSHYHFKHEEDLLESIRYERLAAHREEHLKFIARIEQIRKDLESGASHEPSNNTLDFLGHWLQDHIRAEDMEFCKLLVKKDA